jgi:hypothetical protein
MKKVRKINGASATGSYVIVEMLTAQEAMGTQFYVGEASQDAPQAIVLDVGPQVEQDKWNIHIGDRVVCQGKYTPLPQFREGRKMGVLMPSDIKAVLTEEDE